MPENAPSHTALATAYLRAAHRLLDRPPWILDDPVSVEILGPQGCDRILREVESYQKPARVHLRAHLVVRSRFAEDRLEEAIGGGVEQVVILGAGYDTLAYRQPRWLHRVRFVEIDTPSTQAAKLERLEQARIPVPSNVRHVPLDFQRESLEEGLLCGGLDLGRPIFFSWLGVSMYLDPESVDQVLDAVARCRPGSEMVFTFANRAVVPTRIQERARQVGEEWKCSFLPSELSRKLEDMGYREHQIPSPERIRQLYFEGRTDLAAPIGSTIAWARV